MAVSVPRLLTRELLGLGLNLDLEPELFLLILRDICVDCLHIFSGATRVHAITCRLHACASVEQLLDCGRLVLRQFECLGQVRTLVILFQDGGRAQDTNLLFGELLRNLI